MVLFFVLLAASLSPVFAGGLGGFVDVHIPVPKLPFPNITRTSSGVSEPASSATAVPVHPNTSLPPAAGTAYSSTKTIGFADWAYFLVFGVLVVFSVFVALRHTSGGVYDLSSAIRGLEEASRRFSASYGSAKLSALVEYYRRLREVCAAFGLVEGASEAPSEFLDRVAVALGLDRSDAHTFAEVFGRARYSQGMGAEEEASSARFMAGFVEAVRRRVGVG